MKGRDWGGRLRKEGYNFFEVRKVCRGLVVGPD